MVPAVHVLAPGVVPATRRSCATACAPRRWPPRALLHDLGVIAMLSSSDSQGMGRVGEVVRRAFQNAAAMRARAGAEPGRPTTSACCATSRR